MISIASEVEVRVWLKSELLKVSPRSGDTLPSSMTQKTRKLSHAANAAAACPDMVTALETEGGSETCVLTPEDPSCPHITDLQAHARCTKLEDVTLQKAGA